jgi:hypothetical protein
MYCFPTQTAQETIDSLEMVRQMFELGILQSGFWHQFAMTAHSPVGLEPEKFGVVKESDIVGTFANNDIVHIDNSGAKHEKFSYGLKKSLFNYMHGICLDYPLQEWFDFKVPATKVPDGYIYNVLNEDDSFNIKPTAKVVWTGGKPLVSYYTKNKKGRSWEMAELTFHDKKESFTIQLAKEQGEWLVELLEKIAVSQVKTYTFQQAKQDYENAGLEDFELLWYSKPINTLRDFGLLVL